MTDAKPGNQFDLEQGDINPAYGGVVSGDFGISTDGRKLTFDVEFKPTLEAEKITSVVINMASPDVGVKSGPVTTPDDNYELGIPTWSPALLAGDYFAGATVYTATIVLTADLGWIFDPEFDVDDVKGLIEEYVQTANVGSDGKTLTVVARFAATNPAQPDKPAITTLFLPDGVVGEAYEEVLRADGATPMTWSIDEGMLVLPPGLSLVNNVIQGTPTGLGVIPPTFFFTVKAENAHGVDTKEFSIRIKAADEETIVEGDDWKVVIPEGTKTYTDPDTGDVILPEGGKIELETPDGTTLHLQLPAGAVIENAELGVIRLPAGGEVFNFDENGNQSVGINLPADSTINHEGFVEVADEEFQVLTSDEWVNVDITGQDLLVKFNDDGTLELSSGNPANPDVDPMTIEAGENILISIYNAVISEENDEVVSGSGVAALSAPYKAMVIEVGEGDAIVVVNGKIYNLAKDKNIIITKDADGNYHAEFDEGKKSSGCSTGAGSLLVLLALAGMSFVSKRRR